MKYIPDLELFSKFVSPIYLFLLGTTNFNELNAAELSAFEKDFRRIVSESNDIVIKQLIWDSNWRASLTGAWLAFALNKTEFTDDIGHFLLQGNGGVIGYCYALAKFRTDECSNIIVSYLQQELVFEKYPKEGFQDTALCALLYLDRVNSTKYAQEILKSGGLYDLFINADWHGFKLSNYARWADITPAFKRFENTFDYFTSLTG